MAKHKALNNLMYFYKENNFTSLKLFAQRFNLSYNTLTEQIRNDVNPTEETILNWCVKFNLSRSYFDQERPELSYEDLDCWHHREVRYTLSEVYDAIGKVSEDINFDHEAFERFLKENHN